MLSSHGAHLFAGGLFILLVYGKTLALSTREAVLV